MYLFKYLSTDTQASDADQELARNHISAAHQIFTRFTRSGAGSRAAQIIELLGTRSSAEASHGLLRDENHFGASVCYDAFWQAEKVRLRHQSENNTSMAAQDDGGHGQVLGDTVTALTAHGPPLTMDSSYAARIQLLDLDREYGFPWAIWDNSLYDDAQVAGYFEPDSTGIAGWFS